MILKEKKVHRWAVKVFQDHAAKATIYQVYATTSLDARLVAFALDHGFANAMTEMEPGHVDLALTYTEIVKC